MTVERAPRLARAAAALALIAALAVVAPAGAQDSTPTPSADELWQRYPLHATPDATATTHPARAASSQRPAAAATTDGGGSPLVAILVVLNVLVAGLLVFLLVRQWQRRQRRRDNDETKEIPARAPPPVPAPAPNGERTAARPPAGGRRRSAQWTAEIEWHDAPEGPRFRAVARPDRGGGATPIAETGPLPWPPADEEAVKALSAAVDGLTEALIAAGWTPLPRGEAWYARRFARGPVLATPPERRQRTPAATAAAAPKAAPQPSPEPEPEPEPVAAATRFKRRVAWPDDTADLWRCEIVWNAGYARSQFEAVAYRPGRRRGRTVAESESYKWLLMDDPDPASEHYRADVARLSAALEAAGWEPIEPGPEWYSQRFVWRRESPPPEHINPVPTSQEAR